MNPEPATSAPNPLPSRRLELSIRSVRRGTATESITISDEFALPAAKSFWRNFSRDLEKFWNDHATATPPPSPETEWLILLSNAQAAWNTVMRDLAHSWDARAKELNSLAGTLIEEDAPQEAEECRERQAVYSLCAGQLRKALGKLHGNIQTT